MRLKQTKQQTRYRFVLTFLFLILMGCGSNQNQENVETIARQQDELLSLRTEVKKLQAKLDEYADKDYDSLLNPNIPYDYSIVGDLPTYRYESGDLQFLSSSISSISFYSEGRGILFAALPSDASGGILLVPTEFRYEKTDRVLEICIPIRNADGTSIEDCASYEYSIDNETETMVLTSPHGRTVFRVFLQM